MDKPIRILCVFSSLNRGGAESMCMNLYRLVDRTQVQFDFVKHSSETGAFEEEILSLGGRIFEAPRFKLYNFSAYRRWWEAHFMAHPEHRIIHGHYFTFSAIYFKVAKRFDRLTIGHSHAVRNGKKGLYDRIRCHYENKVERYSDYCFACGEKAGEWLFPHKGFTVLRNAIDTEQYRFDSAVRDEVRQELHLGEEFVVGIVGSMQGVKNPFGTLDIFAAVKAREPKAKLLWVGDGHMRQEIEAGICERGLQDSVILTGVRDDVHRLLQAMDVFMLPSFSEGLPVVSVEAQAAGLSCLFSTGVPQEADITGRCRFLPLGDHEQWADALLAADRSRPDTSKKVINAGYDVRDTAAWLQHFYLKV